MSRPPLDVPADAPSDAPPDDAGPGGGALDRVFGPLTTPRLVVLLVAVAFLGGAVGWAVGQRDDDPLSATDVGFLQDMGYHHDQGVEMSLILLQKDDVEGGLHDYAQEIVVDQRYQQGLFNAIADRFGHASSPRDGEAMGWMGRPVPVDEMSGLATEAQMQELRDATGAEAEALWIALMSEHHLGGLHMADWEARHGRDETTRNLARSIIDTQRGEVFDLDRYRRRRELPIPDGFSDPTEDQRLYPLSHTGD